MHSGYSIHSAVTPDMDIEPFPQIAPLASSMGIRLSRTCIKDNILDADTQIRSVLDFAERFPDIDLFFPIMDTSVEARALGCPFEFKDSVPVITNRMCATASEVMRLDTPDPRQAEGMRTNIDVIQAVTAALDKPVGGFVIGPLTLAAHLMGITSLVKMAMKAPDAFVGILSQCVRTISPYAQALQQAGASVVVVLEPQAGFFSPRIYVSSIREALEDLAAGLHEAVLHVCGDTTSHAEFFARTQGFAGLSLDAPVDLSHLAFHDAEQNSVLLMGNIDPVGVLLRGTPETVRAGVLSLLGSMHSRRFILSSGCDLVPDTPPENLDAFIEAACSCRQKGNHGRLPC